MASSARLVAKRAGVSLSTVSRAFTDPDKLAPTTLAKVRSAAEAVEYTPARVRRRPASVTRNPTIAFITPDIANPFFAAIAKAAQMRAQTRSFNMIIANTSEDIGQESELLAGLLPSVQGVMSCSSRSSDSQVIQMAARIPMVLINRQVDEMHWVAVDERGAMHQVVNHLHALGHRRIAYVGGPAASPSEMERYAALQQIDQTNDGVNMVFLGNSPAFAPSGIAAADLAISAGVTAIIAFNDIVAVGILSRLHQRGLEIPGDMSVVGIDDVLISDSTYPPLTTVTMPKARLGSAATDLLEKVISGQSPEPEQILVPAELVVRQSTGPVGTM